MGYGRSGDKKPRGASRRSRTRPEAPGSPWGLPGSRRPRTRTLGRSNPGVRGVQTLGSPGGPGGPQGPLEPLGGGPGVGVGERFLSPLRRSPNNSERPSLELGAFQDVDAQGELFVDLRIRVARGGNGFPRALLGPSLAEGNTALAASGAWDSLFLQHGD